MRGVLLLLAALLLAAPLHAKQAIPAIDDPVAEKRAVELEEQLRCLVCQNETIAASQADLAKDLRKEIREQIKAGRTDDQIKQYLVDRYGDFVLYKPPFKAHDRPAVGRALRASAGRRHRAVRLPAPAPRQGRAVRLERRAARARRGAAAIEPGSRVTAFWLIATLFVAVALLLVLPPLLRQRKAVGGTDRDATNVKLYRDELDDIEREHGDGTLGEAQYREARQEIERRLLEDVAPAAPRGAARRPAPAPRAGPRWRWRSRCRWSRCSAICSSATSRRSIRWCARRGIRSRRRRSRRWSKKLAQRLKQNPSDADGWTMLGRSYAVLGRYQEAADAYARAAGLMRDNADILADYADTLAMARGGDLVGEPMQIIQRGLSIDPNNVKLLALAGSAEFAQQNYQSAVQYWERSLAHTAPGSDFRRAVESSIEEARQAGNLPAAKKAARAPAGPASAEAITGTVKIAPGLASQVAPGDTLFVFARPATGGRMPLAILRVPASQLPYAFRLDDSLSMAAGSKLSSQAEVVVEARISKSGSAMPQPGDLEATSAPVTPGTSGLALSIDRVVR